MSTRTKVILFGIAEGVFLLLLSVISPNSFSEDLSLFACVNGVMFGLGLLAYAIVHDPGADQRAGM